MKLLIVISTFNRKDITELSLWQTRRFKCDATLLVYDDHSTEYDVSWLACLADEVTKPPEKLGIEKMRALQLRDFLATGYDLLYLTDNDVLHDPNYVFRLRRLYSLPSELKFPVCLFNSWFHAQPENILKEIQDIQIRKTAPGVSQLYDREMVERMVSALRQRPHLWGQYGWDYHLPALLQRPWIQSTTSYLEHFGAHGMHNPAGLEGLDRDRALNPTRYLSRARESVVRYLVAGGHRPSLEMIGL